MTDYLVTWQIDINDEGSPIAAATEALIIQRDNSSMGAVVFDVTDKSTGKVVRIDMLELFEAMVYLESGGGIK